MTYHQFRNENGEAFGSFEVFWDGEPVKPGFYWWACFPGCLPDGEASGPFETEQDAIKDATDYI